MYSLFAMMYILYLFNYVAPPKQIKQLIKCEKNNKELSDEILCLKKTIEVIINARKNETIYLSTCPNLNNCSRDLTTFQI